MFYSIVGFDTGNAVSMKSGLEGRNNFANAVLFTSDNVVSMKSGLEGRNNQPCSVPSWRNL